MMVSAEFPKESIDKVVWTLDAALDYDVAQEEDQELLRHFLVALSKLSREGVVLCKAEDYHRMSDNEDLLYSLKGAGVDNWEGYDLALEDYWENKEQD